MNKKFCLMLGIIFLWLTLIAAQCAPISIPDTASVEVDKAETETESTQVEAEQLEDITLIVWFLSGSPEEVELAQELVNSWAENYDKANVTIDFSSFGFEDWNNAMKLALDGGSGPDLAYGSPGRLTIGAWAEVGHIVDLTDIAKERGWFETIPEDVIWYYNATDRIYSMSYDAVTVGVYYNSEIFDNLGLQAPETFEEFEETLATIKAAGITPIAVGGQTPWTLTHIWEQLTHTNVPWEDIEAWMNLEGGVTPEMEKATDKFHEWAELGYFNDNAIATAYPDGNSLFITGQAAMNIGGTWNNGTFAKQPEFETRFFAMPPMNPDLPEWHAGGFTPNNGWTVPIYSEHQAEAIDLMDFMLGQESALKRWNNGDIVAYNFDEAPEPIFPLQADVFESMQKTKPGVYSGSAAPELGPALGENLQAIVGGLKTPQEAMDAVQEVYERVVAEQSE